jgi:2-polyprenyl-3-methyl-5-hydroxy-6-metoxy-1,4-benzoquinol methylase
MKQSSKFSTVDIFLKNKPYMARCKRCESAFIQNAIRQADAEHLYTIGDGTKRWTGVDFKRDKTTEVVNLTREFLHEGVMLCDIGCNTGEFLNFAKSLGARTHGIELSEESVKACQRNGHEVKSDLRDFDQQFDVITAFDLIEHLYQPVDFIQAVASKLKKGGLFLVLTGNINSLPASRFKEAWWYANYPEHVVFPSKRFYAGLEVLELHRYEKTFASRDQKKEGKQIKNIPLIFKKDGNGRPSYFTDHHVVVLKKSAQ